MDREGTGDEPASPLHRACSFLLRPLRPATAAAVPAARDGVPASLPEPLRRDEGAESTEALGEPGPPMASPYKNADTKRIHKKNK